MNIGVMVLSGFPFLFLFQHVVIFARRSVHVCAGSIFFLHYFFITSRSLERMRIPVDDGNVYSVI